MRNNDNQYCESSIIIIDHHHHHHQSSIINIIIIIIINHQPSPSPLSSSSSIINHQNCCKELTFCWNRLHLRLNVSIGPKVQKSQSYRIFMNFLYFGKSRMGMDTPPASSSMIFPALNLHLLPRFPSRPPWLFRRTMTPTPIPVVVSCSS